MSTTIDAIFKPEELRAARTRAIDEQIKETSTFAKRSSDPAHRVALSELEQLLLKTREAWAAAGLVNAQPSTEGVGRKAAMAA